MNCPNCRAANPEGKRFCGDCGTALPQRCGACGAENPAGKKFCSDCGTALTAGDSTRVHGSQAAASQPIDIAPSSAERRQLTVMFCDLVNSTALASRLDPEDLREVIGAFHRRVADTVAAFDGFVAQYMGDGVLVFFGYPQAHEDDADRSVRAGLALIDAVGQVAAPARLKTHIGIATGLVVVGDLVGAGAALDMGVVGETPNLAARLLGVAEPDSIVIDNSTRQLSGGAFEYTDLGPVAVKGFSEPVRPWRVMRESAAESRFEALHSSALTPLVGREEDLDLLLRRWRQATASDGRVVLLSGEPGIGKSRLIAALVERLQSAPHTRLRYFCAPHYADSALRPVVLQLERAAGFDRDDPQTAKRAKLKTMLARTGTPAEDVAILTDLLSLPSDGPPPPDLTPQRKKEKTFDALVQQLAALARERPVLMVFEDVHWIDASSRELLDVMIERVRHWPVLLLITFRPVFLPPWTDLPHVTFLTLNRLDRNDRNAMIERLTGGKALPLEVSEQIADRADGVPLFLEELTRTVLESGLLREEPDRHVLTGPLPPLAIPTTLQASLMARLDRLATSKDVAQTGAVIGREFSYELIAAVAGVPQPDLRRALDLLVEAGLIFRRGTPPDARYLFKHALVQDAAYASLLKSRRQLLHQRIAQVLEERFPLLAESAPEVLARHFTEAGLLDKAIHKWEMAGRKAIARSAQREAAAHFREGARLVRELPDTVGRHARELALLLPLGDALFGAVGGAAPETVAAFARAKDLARAIDDGEAFCRAVYGMFIAYVLAGRYDQGLLLGAEAREFAATSGSAVAQVVAARVLGNSHYYRGELLDGERYLRAGMEISRQEREVGRNVAGFAHNPLETMSATLAVVTWALGRPDQAIALADESWRVVESGNDGNSMMFVLVWMTVVHLFRRNADAAARCITTLLRLAEERGARFWLSVGTWLQGAGLVQAGRPEEALIQLREGSRHFFAVGSRQYEPFIRYTEAEAHLLCDRADESAACLGLAQQAVEETNQRFFEPEVHRIAAKLHHSRGECDKAEACYRRAVEQARGQSGRSWELRAATGLARLCLEQGRRVEAREILAPIYGWFTEGFDTPDLNEAGALLDQLRE